MLENKKILIGISGSIAAYKSILLVRQLVKAGAIVKVVMTQAAANFVSPLVLETLSKNPVIIDIANNNTWSNHVMLGRWADVFIIAPLSCNTLAKMANGMCDNLLMAVYLSSTCPIVVAPAMDEDMWLHPSTKKNMATIVAYGNKIIEVNDGELASGLIGAGRMAEPEEIVAFIIENFCRTKEFANKNITITAGPTYEAIDPVRFIGNHSSGKMGFALAENFYLKGANVTLISGPTNCKTNFKAIKIIDVVSSNEMFEAVNNVAKATNIFIMSAAVADFKPKTISKTKIKKETANPQIELEKTIDILATIGNNKTENQIVIGFALETNNELENAVKKLKSKNADAIVLNVFNDNNQVFGANTNQITIIDTLGKTYTFDNKTKVEVANDITNFVATKFL
jgi:phosphopantothenoylcysteine decarboxylase / phosphopantothenate---cysteine ligase